MDIKAFFSKRMQDMYKTPCMWAVTKEAFIAQIVVLLEALGARDANLFYSVFGEGKNSVPFEELRSLVDDEWAHDVIRKVEIYVKEAGLGI